MAGHSKFKNIQHRKGAQDRKRAKVFTKLIRDITIAAKSGRDPQLNPRLKLALSTARTNNLPRERIEKALSQADDNVNDNLQEIRYEGFATGGIAIIVEALTDNRNRTASEVRFAFTKFGGNLGETGSVSFMFDHFGIIQYPAEVMSAEDIFEIALDSGAIDVKSDEDYHIIYTKIENFTECSEYLISKLGNPEEASIGWRPQNLIIVNDLEKAEKLLKFIDALEDSDDVQNIYYNYEFSGEVKQQL